jgi:uncharacterized phage-like protein YoqJ
MDNQAQDEAISCCFTGHRPAHLPWGSDDTRPDCEDFYLRLTHATQEMIERGCRFFYVGMAQGIDLIAAQIVLGLRESRPEWGLKFIAVCPHALQAARWNVRDKQMHRFLLDHADEVVVLEGSYTPYCFHKRNRYMVDRCAHVIAGFDGISQGGTASTVAYAKRRCREIVQVLPVKAV